jgi:hypothetical protein
MFRECRDVQYHSRAIRHTGLGVNGILIGDGPCSFYSRGGCNPYIGMHGRPKGKQAVNVWVMEEEDGVESLRNMSKVTQKPDGVARSTRNGLVTHMTTNVNVN